MENGRCMVEDGRWKMYDGRWSSWFVSRASLWEWLKDVHREDMDFLIAGWLVSYHKEHEVGAKLVWCSKGMTLA